MLNIGFRHHYYDHIAIKNPQTLWNNARGLLCDIGVTQINVVTYSIYYTISNNELSTSFCSSCIEFICASSSNLINA